MTTSGPRALIDRDAVLGAIKRRTNRVAQEYRTSDDGPRRSMLKELHVHLTGLGLEIEAIRAVRDLIAVLPTVGAERKPRCGTCAGAGLVEVWRGDHGDMTRTKQCPECGQSRTGEWSLVVPLSAREHTVVKDGCVVGAFGMPVFTVGEP